MTIFIFLGGKDAALSQVNLIYKSITQASFQNKNFHLKMLIKLEKYFNNIKSQAPARILVREWTNSEPSVHLESELQTLVKIFYFFIFSMIDVWNNLGLCIHDFFQCVRVMRGKGMRDSEQCCQTRFDQCYRK